MDEVAGRLVEHAKGITLGDPFDPEIGMGPVINAAQHRSIGGSLVGGAGYFVEPTVFLGRQDQRIAREEIFGPVATIIPFSDAADAVTMANDTAFGLNAIIFTESLHLAHSAARDLRVGNVWVNAYGMPEMATPWGGRGGSGIGREMGRAGIEAYTEEKTIQLIF